MLDYVQLTFTGTGLHTQFMKRNLEIRSTEKGKGCVTVHEKEKPHLNDSQIIHDCLAINGSKLNRHKFIHKTSIKLQPSVTRLCAVSYKYTKAT